MDKTVQEQQLLDSLTSSYLHNSAHRQTIIEPQFVHRLRLIQHWGVEQGAHVIDIGCGQGEATLSLAHAVGPSGHITGIDTGSPDYGSPFTLGQSQQYISNSAPYGDRITFFNTDIASLLSSSSASSSASASTDQSTPTPKLKHPYTAAALSHSLWYFPHRASVSSLFSTLAKKAPSLRTVYIAEHSYHAALPAQVAHVLAARAQALLHTYSTDAEADNEANIRVGLEPRETITLAGEEGWSVAEEGLVTPEAGVRDGVWEVSYVVSEGFAEVVEKREWVSEEKKREVVELVKEVKEAVEKVGGVGEVRAMDTWWCVFKRRTALE